MTVRICRPLLGAVIAGCVGGSVSGQAGAPTGVVDTLPRDATVHVNFVTVHVADFERAFRFYRDVLDMRERGRAQTGPQMLEVVMGFDDLPTSAGISLTVRGSAPDPRGNGSSSINLVVRNLAAIMQQVTSYGGTVQTSLTHVDTARITYSLARITDPDGNSLELVEYHRIARGAPAATRR